MSEPHFDRRNFLKTTLASGAALGTTGAAAQGQEAAAAGEALRPSEKVPRKTLGDTGESIPILLQGGSMKFDRKYDKLLHRAYREGIDYLDTAQVYANGQSHAGIATFLTQVEERKKVWVTSKTPHDDDTATTETFEKGLDRCLKELETDYLDMFFMHGIDNLKYLGPDFIRMGESMRKSKRTRFFGFSCHGANVVELMNKAAEVGGDGLSDEERAVVEKLKARDREVRDHEQAHARVGGQYASEPSYSYQVGPDGRQYAIGGQVKIDVSPVRDDPAATIAKMEIVKAAALAPAEPSSADRQVAATADAVRAQAQADLNAERAAERRGEAVDVRV